MNPVRGESITIPTLKRYYDIPTKSICLEQDERGWRLNAHEWLLPSDYIPQVRRQSDGTCGRCAVLTALEGSYSVQSGVYCSNPLARFPLASDSLVVTDTYLQNYVDAATYPGAHVPLPDYPGQDLYLHCLRHTHCIELVQMEPALVEHRVFGTGPLPFSFPAFDDICFTGAYPDTIYSGIGDIIPDPTVGTHHAVAIVGCGRVYDGYDEIESYWVCQNNWGEDFGNRGIFRVWQGLENDMFSLDCVKYMFGNEFGYRFLA